MQTDSNIKKTTEVNYIEKMLYKLICRIWKWHYHDNPFWKRHAYLPMPTNPTKFDITQIKRNITLPFKLWLFGVVMWTICHYLFWPTETIKQYFCIIGVITMMCIFGFWVLDLTCSGNQSDEYWH